MPKPVVVTSELITQVYDDMLQKKKEETKRMKPGVAEDEDQFLVGMDALAIADLCLTIIAASLNLLKRGQDKYLQELVLGVARVYVEKNIQDENMKIILMKDIEAKLPKLIEAELRKWKNCFLCC